MRHLDPDSILKAATGEPLSAERQAHLDSCPSCRDALGATGSLWSTLQTADPAQQLPDAPVWPGVLAALDATRRSSERTTVLRPRWKTTLREVWSAPAAYAALAAVMIGLGGGFAAGDAVLGLTPRTAEAIPFDGTTWSDYSGLAEGSLAWAFLEEDLETIGAALDDEDSGTPAGDGGGVDDGNGNQGGGAEEDGTPAGDIPVGAGADSAEGGRP